MKKVFLAFLSLHVGIFIGVIAAYQIVPVSCAYAFELYTDSDNNGKIEQSTTEKSLATDPNALGVIVPFFPDKSDKILGFTEFQLTFSPLNNEDLDSKLDFQFGSDEVSLWVNDGHNKKCLFIPPALNNNPALVQTGKLQTQSTLKEKSINNQDDNEEKKSGWWNPFLKMFSTDDIDENEDFDSLKMLPEPTVSLLSYKSSWRELGAKKGDTKLIFYLRAEMPSRVITYKQTAQLKRPTRTLIVKRSNSNSSESAAVQYIVAGKDSFYSFLQKTPELSVILASACVYESQNEKEDKEAWGYNPQQYCLSVVDEKGLLALGFSDYSLRYFHEQDNSGYAVALYKDHINNRYILAFRGTSFNLSMIEDIVEDVNVVAGRYSPYILKALFCGYYTGKIFEDKKTNIVITGHSLGGALACAAGITAGLPVITINGLGINKESLSNTLKEYEFNSPPNSEMEFKNLCKTKFDNLQTDNIRYVRTKWDLLSILCDEVNSPLYLKNGNSIDIFPNVQGKPLIIDEICCDRLETENDIDIERIEKGEFLYETIHRLDEVVKYCGEKQKAKEKFSFKDACKSIFSNFSVVSKLSKMQSQIKISGKCHSVNQVIYGILKIKNAESMY